MKGDLHMIKKIRRIPFILIIVMLSIVILGCDTVTTKKEVVKNEQQVVNSAIDEPIKKNTTDADISFSVLGDVHEDVDNFQQAVEDLYEINPNQDLLVLNGDVVGQGLVAEYDSMKNALDKNMNILPGNIIKNIGNHEFFDYTKKNNSSEDVKEFINRYFEFSGENKVYHDKWINDYHFISLGSEEGNTKALGSVKAYLSKEQLRWFDEKLKENHKVGKPIFVFLHQHIDESINGWSGSDQRENVKKILSKYPEAIIFTSHTHLPLEKHNITLNQPYTIVHTGAVQYTLLIDTKGKIKREPYNEGVYIEAKGNKVTIKGRSFKTKQWLFTQEI